MTAAKPTRTYLVALAEALLRVAEAAAREAGLRFTGSCSPAQERLREERPKRWDLAEATFRCMPSRRQIAATC